MEIQDPRRESRSRDERQGLPSETRDKAASAPRVSLCLSRCVCVMSSHTYTHTESGRETIISHEEGGSRCDDSCLSLSRRQGVARGKSDKSADGIKSPASLAPTLAHTQSLACTGRRGETETSSLQRHSNRRSSATAAAAALASLTCY